MFPKRITPIVLLFLLKSLSFCSPASSKHEFFSGNLELLSGGEVKLAENLGKVVVLDFWATWCEPCAKAVPTINRWQEKEDPKDFIFWGVNTDTTATKDEVLKHSKTLEMSYPSVLDPEWKLTEFYKVDGIPCVLVFDRQGRIVYRQYGLSSEDLPGLIVRSEIWKRE